MATGRERAERPESPMSVGSRLPSLRSHTDSGELRWRDPAGGATVAVFLQSRDQDADRAYLSELAEAADRFRLWSGRVIVVTPDEEVAAGARSGSGGAAGAVSSAGAGAPSGAPVGAERGATASSSETHGISGPGSDRHGTISIVTEPAGEAEHCGVRAGEDAILIADRWGEVYYGARGSAPDVLPDTTEIEEWLKFLATQCPECGVPDEP